MGKEPGTKAYRLLDPETNKIHVSRDVAFEETKAWPWNRLNSETEVVTSSFEIDGYDDTFEQSQVSTERMYTTDEVKSPGDTTPETQSRETRLSPVWLEEKRGEGRGREGYEI